MNKLTKAILMPFMRLLQVLLAAVIFAIFATIIISAAIVEYHFWYWSWLGCIGINALVAYVITVVYCYTTNSNWWPE